MTIVVTVKINDGIVLAADSASTFYDDKGEFLNIYNNANKVFNLVKGLPIGGLSWGAGGIGSASIATIVKDLRRRLAGQDAKFASWQLDPGSYTVQQVAQRVREFLFDELFMGAYGANPPANYFLGFKVCGYSAGAPLSEVLGIKIINSNCDPPILEQRQDWMGVRWDGEYESMDRLVLGVGSAIASKLENIGIDKTRARDAADQLISDLAKWPVLAGMPIQDAIELALFMVETSIKFVKFNMGHNTVGGPIEIAAITKHEGFKWVQRKLFYTGELNP
jgi:hypothetical protein